MKKIMTIFRGLLFITISLIVLTFPAIPTSAVVSPVNLTLSPSNTNTGVGGTFTVTIQAQCGSQTTDGIDVYIDFNPTYLSVQSVTAGTTLSTILMAPIFDNTAGTIGFSAGQLTAPYPSGTFTVLTISFQAKSVTASPTPISFHSASQRLTMVDSGGSNITGTLTGATVVIMADAPLSLTPSSVTSICSTQIFSLDLKTNVGANQQVSGVQAYIIFDPTKLQVVDADPVQSGIQVTPGANLTTVLQNTVDNNNGLINFGAGKLGAPFPTGIFTVASIQFQARTVSNNVTTEVKISVSGSSGTSIVDFGGTAISGTHTNASVQIIPGANVVLNKVLQGGSRPDSGWVVPVTINFFTPGTSTPVDVLTATPVYSFNLTTAKNGGTATDQASGVIPGTYDISVTSPHCLTNVRRAVVIDVPSTSMDMGTLLEGNANDDNKINIQDFGILALAYGKTSGSSGYDARADFDRNGVINIADFGLLAANYGKNSPVEVP